MLPEKKNKQTRRKFLQVGTSAGLSAVGLAFAGCRHLLTNTDKKVHVLSTMCKFVSTPNRYLDLPAGFSCHAISQVGEEMDDGLLVPGKHDGMAAFASERGRIVLMRNHELYAHDVMKGAFGKLNTRLRHVDRKKLYDAGHGILPCLGAVTTVVYNPRTGKVDKHYLSLAGTMRNCSGGPTPWGTWVTCEENVQCAGLTFEKDHGYNFEVPATSVPQLTKAVPLRAMGRFNHEAIAVEPRSGVVYQTEDRKDGLFYRFIPNRKGQLAAGGRLQALRLLDQKGADTRNWPSKQSTRIPLGKVMQVTWVELDNIDSPEDDLRQRGRKERGAAQFARGEGIWCDGKAVYFACTSGGSKRKGQIWRYVPSPDEGTTREQHTPATLELFVEPEDSNLLDNCDNLTVAPWGDLIVCEDGVDCEDGTKEECLIGITPKGQTYRFARNARNPSELAGATFSPDGNILFVNIQEPGITLAITGPWHKLSKS